MKRRKPNNYEPLVALLKVVLVLLLFVFLAITMYKVVVLVCAAIANSMTNTSEILNY